MVTSGINTEVTVALMRISGTMPDIRPKTPDIVVRYAGFDRLETLKITPKTLLFTRYENLLDYA